MSDIVVEKAHPHPPTPPAEPRRGELEWTSHHSTAQISPDEAPLWMQQYRMPPVAEHPLDLIPRAPALLVNRTEAVIRFYRLLPDGTEFTFRARPTDIGIYPAGYPARSWWRCEAPLRILVLHVAPSLIEAVARQHDVSPLLPMSPPFEAPFLRETALDVVQTIEEGETTPVYLETMAHMVATHLCRHHAAPREEGTVGLAPNRVRQVYRYVHAHLDTNLEVADLADHVGLPPDRFARGFSRRVGVSPYQYVLWCRVEEAKRQLRNTAHPIAQIALDTGFSSQSHLTRRFKDIVDTTPGAYRQEVASPIPT